MCNAWNHSADCTCGWGGFGHLGGGGGGRGGGGARADLALFRHLLATQANYRRRYETVTNPNARCPVCRVPVFFYQSPDGGRVFFDSPGPPWPKHPCTSNDAPSSSRLRSVEATLGIGDAAPLQFAWEAEGWMPVADAELKDAFLQAQCYRLKGVVLTGAVMVYFRCPTSLEGFEFFMRAHGDGVYSIATFRVENSGTVTRNEYRGLVNRNRLQEEFPP